MYAKRIALTWSAHLVIATFSFAAVFWDGLTNTTLVADVFATITLGDAQFVAKTTGRSLSTANAFAACRILGRFIPAELHNVFTAVGGVCVIAIWQAGAFCQLHVTHSLTAIWIHLFRTSAALITCVGATVAKANTAIVTPAISSIQATISYTAIRIARLLFLAEVGEVITAIAFHRTTQLTRTTAGSDGATDILAGIIQLFWAEAAKGTGIAAAIAVGDTIRVALTAIPFDGFSANAFTAIDDRRHTTLTQGAREVGANGVPVVVTTIGIFRTNQFLASGVIATGATVAHTAISSVLFRQITDTARIACILTARIIFHAQGITPTSVRRLLTAEPITGGTLLFTTLGTTDQGRSNETEVIPCGGTAS